MTIIQYEYGAGESALEQTKTLIYNRYQELKNKMLSSFSIRELQQQKIKKIQKYLTELNAAYAQYSPAKIEELLAKTVSSKINSDLNEALTEISQNASGFSNEEKYDNELRVASQSKFLQGVGKLQSLYEQGKAMGGKISIDSNSFMQEVLQTQQSLLAAQQGYATLSQALGHIGALSGAILAKDIQEQLIDENFSKDKNITIYNTGSNKTRRSNRTVSADTVSLITTQTPEGTFINASLTISDKFNMSFHKNNGSTTRPIKLASRKVNTFLSEIKNPTLRSSYEKALMNYLSYHAQYEPHFKRWDFTQVDREGWQDLRRAIGAEMLYNELYTPGKGQMLIGEQIVEDGVDLYIYGDKIFLASDILDSQYKKRGPLEITPAQVSLSHKKKLLTTANIQSMPRSEVLDAPDPRENKVYSLLLPSIISYSQAIHFS